MFKLPELKIEKFGDCTENPFCFSKIRASFDKDLTAVGSIFDSQKLYFLKSTLKDKALS